MKFRIWNFGFLVLIFVFLSGCQNHHLYKDTRVMMGTFVEVTSPHKDAANIVFAEIKRIEELLSKYIPESEVSRLNKLDKLVVSPETFYVIEKAKEFWQLSDGEFDITVGPLVTLWGFTNKDFSIPYEAQIKNTLKLVGSDKIILHKDNNMVELTFPGMSIDLGAIAKGFALDCAAAKLKINRINSCLINAGGQICAIGDKFGRPWLIGIRSPRGKNIIKYLKIKDKSVSTSGDYEQYFIRGKKRYPHIFNPKTGYPAESDVISVTVIADNGLTADALSTAIFALGKIKGKALADKFKPVAEVKIVEKNE